MFPKKDDDHFGMLVEAMAVGGSRMIENQEKRGQDLLVNSTVLPKHINYGTREQFEEMGIVFGDEADDIFVYVALPEGWKKEPTSHSMWSRLVDEKGRERASIFYKAAFYDRSAHMGINRRFGYSTYQECDENGNICNGKHIQSTHFATCITDSGKICKLIAIRSYEDRYGETSDKHEEMAKAYLDENYPDWKNPRAYWD